MTTVKPIVSIVFAILLLSVLTMGGPKYTLSPQLIDFTSGTSGRVIFAVTDAAANMQTVTSVAITVTAVKVHNADGWVTISSTPQTYDLLQLKEAGTQALIADTSLKPGIYDQMRLDISSVTVTDANGAHQAKLPSGELKIIGPFEVIANATTTATFDFIVDESLHTTEKGEYVLVPVIQLETRERVVDLIFHPNNHVDIRGGIVRIRTKIGMDIDGNMGTGLNIGRDKRIVIEGERIVIR